MKRTKPSIKSPCTAERYNDQKWSRIAEFCGEVGGGLIKVSDWTVDGVAFVRVELYRLDKDVRVRCDAHQLELSDNQWAALEKIVDQRRKDRVEAALNRRPTGRVKKESAGI